ncbi:hypothetical protein [Falsibacillus pallidus]|uniref:Uncharacterized protein n=1 Tax=Falsibacillus pallidus TaxID=493781 RepID=A0A370G1G3_9BACI|nr:hypothetical protein [Falsibacillus pallidus]RDI36454.1 hypothetical protein DFR59_13011 [Falsibacillus pallidus]
MAKSMKSRAATWIRQRVEDSYIQSEQDSLKKHYLRFKLVGFCDEPEIHLVAKDDGLEWGYTVFFLDGSVPVPKKVQLHALSWTELNAIPEEEKVDKIHEEMMKAINLKKKEYRKCQYCENKMHQDEFYDKKTCKKCAKKHHGIYSGN